ncbi:MAG: hypothetical protein JXC85_02345 [Candidatus Aenigmarchaeota archaeon]|nr:hypothetical protein [Candidatus Aenigmarchaeota archaeon]
MKRQIFWLSIAFVSVGMLLSGLQSITGYYADPSGYGFHHIQGGYFFLSVAVTLLGTMAMMPIIKRLGRLI